MVFDLGNVLVPVRRSRAVDKLEPLLPENVRVSLRGDETALDRLIAGPLKRLETGAIEFDEFGSEAGEALGIDLSEHDFLTIWCDMFDLNPETTALGTALAQSYGTWLASNTSRVHYEWIVERFPEIRFYRDAALSYELGVMKPDEEYFHRALRKFGIEAHESVFIDDSDPNVQAARRVGMHAVVYREFNQLVRELTALGIAIPDRWRSSHG